MNELVAEMGRINNEIQEKRDRLPESEESERNAIYEELFNLGKISGELKNQIDVLTDEISVLYQQSLNKE